MWVLRILLVVTMVVVFSCSALPVQASIVLADSLNDTDSPINSLFGVPLIGWLYTPASSYDLVRVETKFWIADARLVTLEIYDEHPGLNGGVLLRSVDFTPLSNAFSGAQFASLPLAAGEDYFIGFRNVQALGNNFSGSFPNQMLTAWVDRNLNGSYTESAPQLEFSSPILKLYTESASVPTPSSFTIVSVLIVSGWLRAARQRGWT